MKPKLITLFGALVTSSNEYNDIRPWTKGIYLSPIISGRHIKYQVLEYWVLVFVSWSVDQRVPTRGFRGRLVAPPTSAARGVSGCAQYWCCRIKVKGQQSLSNRNWLQALHGPYQRYELIKVIDSPLEQVLTRAVVNMFFLPWITRSSISWRRERKPEMAITSVNLAMNRIIGDKRRKRVMGFSK